MSHFKLILHRALYVRTRNPAATTRKCRCCDGANETIEHLGKCPEIRKAFAIVDSIANITSKDSSYYLFFINQGASLPRGVCDLMLTTWKFVLIAFTRVDLENQPFSPDRIATDGLRRYISKINRAAHHTHLAAIYKRKAGAMPLQCQIT